MDAILDEVWTSEAYTDRQNITENATEYEFVREAEDSTMMQQQYGVQTATMTAEINSHYEHARWKAYLHRIVSLVTSRDNTLQSSSDVLAGCRPHGQSDVGIHTVPIADIVGSINRAQDFDRTFMPAQAHTRERWLSVDRAYHRGISLPPVELYQIGDGYLVLDGHHRLSVASAHGQEYIEAHVVRQDVICSVDSAD